MTDPSSSDPSLSDSSLSDLRAAGSPVPAASARPSPGQRLLALAEVVLCSDLPTQLGIALVLKLAGWSPTGADGALSFRYVVVLSLVDVVLLVALMVGCLRLAGERPSDLWLGHRPVRHEARLGLLLIPVVFLSVAVVVTAVRFLFPALHNVPQNPLEQLARTPVEAAIFIIVVIVAGGIREELQRAFLLRRFEQYLGGRWVGVVVLSVAFGLGHTMQGWDAVVATGMLGALWSLIYIRRRSSIAPIVSHAGFNAVELVLALLARSVSRP